MDSSQSRSPQFNSNVQINKFFVKNMTNIIFNNEKPTTKKPNNEKPNKYAGLGLTNERNRNFQLTKDQKRKMYKTYLKKTDVLGRNKFSRKNYEVACQATLLLSKLLLSYTGIKIN